MEKLVYLLWREAREPGVAFAQRLVGSAGPELVRLGARSLELHVADAAADLNATVPIRDERDAIAGTASFWLPSLDERGPLERALGDACARSTGYLVTESVPRDRARDWPLGARSPGLVMISAFPQPARLARDEFLARWHGSHTPLSLEVHPLWRYVRNSVARPLAPGARALAGIVFEQVREPADLLDPARFYGGRERMAENMKRILEDAQSFLDLPDVMSVVTSEYLLS